MNVSVQQVNRATTRLTRTRTRHTPPGSMRTCPLTPRVMSMFGSGHSPHVVVNHDIDQTFPLATIIS